MKSVTNSSSPNGSGRPPRKIELAVPKFLTVQIQQTASDTQNRTKEEADRKTQIRLSKWMNCITAAGYSISLCALIALIKSLTLSSAATQAAVQQSKTSQAEYLSSQRPWISIRPTATKLYMLPNGAAQIDPLTYEAVNVGHSVALHVVVIPRLVTRETMTGHECEIPEMSMKDFSRKGNGVVIFPSEGAKAHFPGWMSPDEVRKAFLKSSTLTNLNPMEIRKCVYTGPQVAFIDDLNALDEWLHR